MFETLTSLEPSDEQGLEAKNNVVNRLRHVMERFDQRLTLKNLRLAERYLKCELHLLVYFCVGEIGEEFVACLQREQAISGPHKNVGDGHVLEDVSPSAFGPHLLLEHALHIRCEVDTPIVGTNRDNQAVFVDVVKFVETPERIIPTLVWFNRVDSFNRIWPHALYFSSSVGFVLRGVVGVRNRETGLPIGRSAADENELISQVVKGAPDIMECVSSDNRQSHGDFTHADKIIDQLSCLRVALGSDYVWVGHKERPDFCLKITDVLFGPFDFYADKREPFIRGHGVYSDYEQGKETDAKDTKGLSDSGAKTERLSEESQESRQSVSGKQPEEVTARTAHDDHSDCCSATHTHSNSLVDA